MVKERGMKKMREVLYRAKAINRDEGYHRTRYKNGEWVFGLVTRPYDERFENIPAEMRNTDGISGIEIDYKTIGEFTCLPDKNNKKIFEDDIILYRNVPCVVKYNVQIASYTLYAYGTLDISGFNADTMKLAEIIGNIYDNPELLSHS